MSHALLRSVLDALHRRFRVGATLEYPGFIAIPEQVVLGDSLASASWAVGPDGDDWTGQLMSLSGETVATFSVRPVSTDPNDIADAVYVHGIGDRSIDGGCTDADCPLQHVNALTNTRTATHPDGKEVR